MKIKILNLNKGRWKSPSLIHLTLCLVWCINMAGLFGQQFSTSVGINYYQMSNPESYPIRSNFVTDIMDQYFETSPGFGIHFISGEKQNNIYSSVSLRKVKSHVEYSAPYLPGINPLVPTTEFTINKYWYIDIALGLEHRMDKLSLVGFVWSGYLIDFTNTHQFNRYFSPGQFNVGSDRRRQHRKEKGSLTQFDLGVGIRSNYSLNSRISIGLESKIGFLDQIDDDESLNSRVWGAGLFVGYHFGN